MKLEALQEMLEPLWWTDDTFFGKSYCVVMLCAEYAENTSALRYDFGLKAEDYTSTFPKGTIILFYYYETGGPSIFAGTIPPEVSVASYAELLRFLSKKQGPFKSVQLIEECLERCRRECEDIDEEDSDQEEY